MLTPEQARDLVDWAGSQRGAAAAIGVVHSTIQHWLDPERVREGDRKRYRELRRDPEYRERERERDRKRYRERYYRRKDAGLCVACGEPVLSETRCWSCLNAFEQYRHERRARESAIAV